MDTAESWVGGVNALMHTVNGGQTWIDKLVRDPQPMVGNVEAIHFSSRMHGIAVGHFNELMLTEDGGTNWKKGVMDFDINTYRADYYSAFLLDANFGWAAGTGGFIIKTKDGGKTWQRVADPVFAADIRISDIRFLDSKIGFAAGSFGLYSTKDGGDTWSKSPTNMGVRMQVFSDRHVIASNFKMVGQYLESKDGGATSADVGLNVSETPASISFLDPNQGWALNVTGHTNAGRT